MWAWNFREFVFLGKRRKFIAMAGLGFLEERDKIKSPSVRKSGGAERVLAK